jgi:hypothetical protein
MTNLNIWKWENNQEKRKRNQKLYINKDIFPYTQNWICIAVKLITKLKFEFEIKRMKKEKESEIIKEEKKMKTRVGPYPCWRPTYARPASPR